MQNNSNPNQAQDNDSSVDDDFIKSLEFSLDGMEKEQKKGSVENNNQNNEPQIMPQENNTPLPTNFSRKLREMKVRLSQLEDFRSDDEIEKITNEVTTKGGQTLVEGIKELNNNLKAVLENQENMFAELTKPLDGSSVSTGQIFELANQVEGLKKEIEELRSNKNNINTTSGTSEIGAIGDTVESLKNSIFMLNKKMDMVNQEERVAKLESKMKEVIEYLHQMSLHINNSASH